MELSLSTSAFDFSRAYVMACLEEKRHRPGLWRVFAESNSIELSLAKNVVLNSIIPNRFILLFAVSNSIVRNLCIWNWEVGGMFVRKGGCTPIYEVTLTLAYVRKT